MRVAMEHIKNIGPWFIIHGFFPHNLFTKVEYFRKIIFDEPFEDLAPVVLRVWRVMVQIMMELRIVFKLLLPTGFFWEFFFIGS